MTRRLRVGKLVPLLALADAAGRLGCVHREAAGGAVDEALAVYHVGSRFHACATVEHGGQLYLLVADS